MNDTRDSEKTRREFLHSSTSVAAGGVLASQIGFPALVSGAGQSQTLKVGLIGCGGRGSGAALNALKADSNIELSAMGDLFKNNLESSLSSLQKEIPDKIKVPSHQQFVGFDAYQQVINSDVDIVLLATPPGFRPLHLKAAIEGGKHAFVEITAAIDGPGVRSVLKSSELAETKGLAIVSGFCWRYNDSMRAVAEQIKAGAIGEVRALYATYYRHSLDHKYHGKRTPEMSDLEWQIRDWYNCLWLSGDVTIVLSGGHSVDKMSWWLDDMMPTAAVALGSRAIPAEGNTFDNGFVVYEYANGIRGFLGCRSQDGCYSANGDYIIGSKGICKIGRTPVIEGETNWRYQGKKNNMYQTEHDDFIASIRAGKPINDGTRMAHTSLMAILGRMAAYTGKRITWEQALNSQQKLVPDELGWNSKIDETPRAVPGITRFI
ncbi:Gfo/Idh/MocA family oxidoreductase [uncultured Gimesia sp.]|uniref:Gfo/Idh/MocA family protein n=1 Tax=uncultured Gimesia sp. TaxID=1678688 RepID=UPI0026081374|nr:Gfo/Idh/MocA family oxidoreductase [uncultured Gimesia sp.]